MRLKNIPAAAEAIENSDFCVQAANNNKGHWKDVFLNNNPIEIEIGMGKGQFITEMAVRCPRRNFIGIEKYTSVIYRAVQKLEAMGQDAPKNLLLLCEDAARLSEIFEPGEISAIYLNFSDPWPKDRHAKRRLTHRGFLEKYYSLLPEGGIITLKTDNENLFDFSIEEINNTPWFDISEINRDLYKDGPPGENIPTEYEDKFSAEGIPIQRLIAKRV